MAELRNFVFKNQLNEPIIDGLADQNADENCLPTCIAAGLQYETGKEYTGSEVEHAVYGPTYHGGTSAVEYVHYVQSQGTSFYSENGTPTYLVGRIHYHLSCGRPVIGTIPSCYCPPQNRLDPGSSHCIIFYKDSLNPGVLIAMNPWQAISQGNTDQWWIDRFCYDQIWILDKKGTPHMGGIPQGWHDDGTTLIAPNGKRLEHGFRAYVMAHDWHPEDVPLEEEHSDPRGGTALVFMNERLRYEDKRGVYPEGLGIGTLEMQAQLKAAEDKNTALLHEVAQLKAAPAPPPPPPPAPAPQPEPDFLKELNAIEGQLAGLIDSLSSSPTQKG